jgi:hypothetical protein
MKRLWMFMAVVMAAGCTAKSAVSSVKEETSSESEETAETTPAPEEETAAVSVPADFDPAGDYEDEWSQRAGLHIEKLEDGTYAGTVHWGASAYEAAVWTFTGEWNPADGSLTYSDCRNVYVTYSETGEESEEVTYEEGTGKFQYEDGVLLWQDDNDPQGMDCRFRKQ